MEMRAKVLGWTIIENMKTPKAKAEKPKAPKCRLHVLEYNDFKEPWAKYYVAIPPNWELPVLNRPWKFMTKEEAEGFAIWFEDVLGFLDYFIAKEVLAPSGKTVVEAVQWFAENKQRFVPVTELAKKE